MTCRTRVVTVGIQLKYVENQVLMESASSVSFLCSAAIGMNSSPYPLSASPLHVTRLQAAAIIFYCNFVYLSLQKLL